MYTREQVESVMKTKGFSYFDNGKDYNLNIIGIRNSDVGKKVSNLFDDILTLSYRLNGTWIFRAWPITTDPGKRSVVQFENSMGVARLVPGQYRGSHQIGLHKGKYEALCQRKPVKVYRDSNRDMVFEENKITEGIYGINIHKAGLKSLYVENWSAGCQVFQFQKDFDEFMKICKKASQVYDNSFTYTLLESKDFNPTV
jgi:hypothetical protein